MTGHVSPVRTSDWVRPGHNIALCDTCGSPSVSAFTSRSRRDEWARTHARSTGHDVTRIDGGTTPGLMDPSERTLIRVLTGICGVLTLTGFALTATGVSPGAVTMFIGAGFWVVIGSAALAWDTWARRRRGRGGDPR